MKALKFDGELATPIKWQGPGRTAGGQRSATSPLEEREEQREVQRVRNELVRKLNLLADALGIDHSDLNTKLQLLLLAMCRQFVPGCRVDYGRRGQPKKWDYAAQQRLVQDADAERRSGARNDYEACMRLVKKAQGRGSGFYYSEKLKRRDGGSIGQAVSSLAGRLSEARRRQRVESDLQLCVLPENASTRRRIAREHSLLRNKSSRPWPG